MNNNFQNVQPNTPQNFLPQQSQSINFTQQYPQNIQINQNINQNPQNNDSFFSKYKIPIIVLSVILVILIIVLLIVFLMPKQQPGPQMVTLTVWTRKLNENKFRQVIENFEKEYPYIKVNLEVQSETEYKRRIINRINNRVTNMANIVEINEDWLYDFDPSTLLPLSDENINKNVTLALRKTNTAYTVQLAIPFRFDSLLLAYNVEDLKDIDFDTVGEFKEFNWARLLQISPDLVETKNEIDQRTQKEIKKVTKGSIAIGSPVYNKRSIDILEMLFIQNNVAFYDEVKNEFLYSDKMYDSISFYLSFVVEGAWDDRLGNYLDAFGEGKVTFILVNAEDIRYLEKKYPDLEFNTTLPPIISDAKNISLGTSLIVPNYMPNTNESKLFLEYLLRYESQRTLLDIDSDKPFLPSSTRVLDEIADNSRYNSFASLTNIVYGRNYPSPETVRNKFNAYLIDIYSKYYSSTNQSIDRLHTVQGVQGIINELNNR